jgi:hypothetical protein
MKKISLLLGLVLTYSVANAFNQYMVSFIGIAQIQSSTFQGESGFNFYVGENGDWQGVSGAGSNTLTISADYSPTTAINNTLANLNNPFSYQSINSQPYNFAMTMNLSFISGRTLYTCSNVALAMGPYTDEEEVTYNAWYFWGNISTYANPYTNVQEISPIQAVNYDLSPFTHQPAQSTKMQCAQYVSFNNQWVQQSTLAIFNVAPIDGTPGSPGAFQLTLTQ